MTLRELWDSLTDFFFRYIGTIFSENILDWPIPYIVLTLVVGLFILGIAFALLEQILILVQWVLHPVGRGFSYLEQSLGNIGASVVFFFVVVILIVVITLLLGGI